MSSILLLNCVLAWLFVTTGAITVSVDRADIKTPPTRSSMIANGWRPLTNSYEETIGTNVSPSSHLEKNVQVHPVLSKFQEHMAASEKLKPLRKGKPPVHEYNPPSILGSFTVFGHAATKARGETKTPSKHVGAATETREYTFLIPPPKDAYRFEVSQHRKPIVRDAGGYLGRQPPQAAAYVAAPSVHQQPLDTVRAATYIIKGFPSNRPYVPPYAMPQSLQPPRQPEKSAAPPFESLKVANSAKPYFQPPGADVPGDFGKQKIAGNGGDVYDRYQAQSHNAQVLSSASTGNFYSHVNHPANHHYKSTYERDPAFLVHESHEVSYVTPPGTYSAYSFRPSLPYETLLPPAVYSPPSTPASTTAVTRNPSKYGQTNDAAREHYNKQRPDPGTRNKQEKGGQTDLPNPRTTSTYYVSEQQEHTPPTWPKSKYPSDINEVLPKENPPGKFSQEVVNQNQITQGPKIVYHRPQNPFEPVAVYPPTPIPDYETPESISLKHFNEQQFLLQQQLLLRDRHRLAEQERQKLEIERQQQEELKKHQDELNPRLLAQRQKEEEEAARLAAESAKNQSREIVKISSEMPYPIQLAQFEPQVTTDGNILVSPPGIYNVEQLRLQPQIPQIPENQVNQNYQYQQYYQNGYQEQQVNYREPQTETRPYRPQKPSRDPQRRKKPSSIAHELSPTDPPSQPPETTVPLTLYAEEVPIQTTAAPEVQTTATAQRLRTRRPAAPGRRRKPIATTTEEPVTTSYAEEDFLKYNREDVQHNQHDSSRRRRIKPTQASYNEDGTSTEKRGNVRKRPASHRTKVSQDGESYDAQIGVTENAHESLNVYGQTTEIAPTSYDENNNQYATNQPSVSYGSGQLINQYYDYSSQQQQQQQQQNEGYREDQREDIIEVPEQVPEYLAEISRDNVDTRQPNVNVVTSIPLEELYVKTDGNYYDRATTDASTTATTATALTPTTTTTAAPQPVTQAPQIATSTSRSHKIRPLRYGNATRPRFSIKDYKSRMDYKTRIAQSGASTTETAPSSEALTRASHHTRQRTSSAKSQQAQPTGADNVRETTGRYKYVSRVNYRTTTSSPTSAARDHERYSEEGASSTTEKSRFVPKRRPVSGNVYRSRIATTTTSPTRSQINGEASQARQTARPENVYSSSVRRRPVMKSRLQKESNAATAYPDGKRQEELSTEMTAEETSFYSTASSNAGRFVGNEIVSEKGEAASFDGHPVKLGVQESKSQGEATVSRNEETRTAPTGGDATTTLGDEPERSGDLRVEKSPEVSSTDAGSSEDDAAARGEAQPGATETATKESEDARSKEEELFAKASQSVADLTSSASALYDKPGMFKAVSPESRLIASQFKITTDEPTLPIEAFFRSSRRGTDRKSGGSLAHLKRENFTNVGKKKLRGFLEAFYQPWSLR
ncbi:uncharacterized protein LOC105840808 [Monomorium pharaonis]|uniref:uncharacterized protein LOC105840808 n=1 Tax=Monomorium pharaonis TaxID=307658 RepID=UPI0017463A70|nr:uncharacterized protein LOC105840808 [Monomorium pharaonis]